MVDPILCLPVPDVDWLWGGCLHCCHSYVYLRWCRTVLSNAKTGHAQGPNIRQTVTGLLSLLLARNFRLLVIHCSQGPGRGELQHVQCKVLLARTYLDQSALAISSCTT